MKTLIEIAIEKLQKHGYKAEVSGLIGGWINVTEPAVIRSGGQPDRIVNDITTIHHTRVWDFINERS
jgi:hypothetical protein